MQVKDFQNLDILSEFIRKEIGIFFPPKKYTEMSVKITELAKEHGFKKIEPFIEYLSNENGSRQKAELLASKFSIGETYFWRDRELFRVLEEEIFPNIIREKENSRKILRIWSAAASTGEEAYSIAILLKRLIPNIYSWNINILATDINPNFLDKARRGRYTEWSFRSAPAWLKPNYFKKIKHNEYALDESIKRMVNFSYLNLIEDAFPSLSNNTNGMDLILCRNVLMYFSQQDIINVSDKLYNCLLPDGLMITTPSESFQYLSPRFKTRIVNRVSVYQKTDKEAKSIEKKVAEADVNVDIAELLRNAGELRRQNAKNKEKSTKKKAIKKDINQSLVDNKKTDNIESFDVEDVNYLINKGNYEKAESILAKTLSNKALPENLLLMARIKANLGKLNEALDYCDKSLEINKLNPLAYYIQSIITAEKGDLELAY